MTTRKTLDDHIGMQAAEAYAAENGEGAALGPLEKVFNDPDVMAAKRRMALLKKERIAQTIRQLEMRVADRDGIALEAECVIPLDQFIHGILHEGGDYWENEDVLRDFKHYNKDLVFKQEQRTHRAGWRPEIELAGPQWTRGAGTRLIVEGSKYGLGVAA